MKGYRPKVRQFQNQETKLVVRLLQKYMLKLRVRTTGTKCTPQNKNACMYQWLQLKITIPVFKLLSATAINREEGRASRSSFCVQNGHQIVVENDHTEPKKKNNASSPHSMLSPRKRYFLSSVPSGLARTSVLDFGRQYQSLMPETQLPNDSQGPKCSF